MATAERLLRPPYPESQRMLEEEATLTLKLSIDASGRVVAVEPVGSADRAFLDSARKHLLSVWRFTPATEDGKPVPSTKVITLRFELGEAPPRPIYAICRFFLPSPVPAPRSPTCSPSCASAAGNR